MTHSRKRSFVISFSVIVFLLIMVGGCASTSSLKAVQTDAQEALQRADVALQEAQSAKTAALDCSRQGTAATAAVRKAEEAAVRSERAAKEARDFARKAEAIFNKMMSK